MICHIDSVVIQEPYYCSTWLRSLSIYYIPKQSLVSTEQDYSVWISWPFLNRNGGGYLTIGVNIKILPNLDSVAFFKQNWGCLKIGVNIKILPNLDSMAFFTQKMKGCLIIGVNNKILPSLDSIPFFTKKLGVCLAFFIHRKGRVLDIWCEL